MLVGRVVGGLVGRLVTRRRLHGKISRDGDSKGEAKEVGSRMQLRRFMLLGQLALALLEAGEAGAGSYGSWRWRWKLALEAGAGAGSCRWKLRWKLAAGSWRQPTHGPSQSTQGSGAGAGSCAGSWRWRWKLARRRFMIRRMSV